MGTVAEIEQAVTRLSEKELANFRQWFDEYDAQLWDMPLEADAQSGKFDKLAQQAIEYLYAYKGKYLLVPNTPVEVCLNCGMVYYDAEVLKNIEQQFFAIERQEQKPDRYVQMPEVAYA